MIFFGMFDRVAPVDAFFFMVGFHMSVIIHYLLLTREVYDNMRLFLRICANLMAAGVTMFMLIVVFVATASPNTHRIFVLMGLTAIYGCMVLVHFVNWSRLMHIAALEAILASVLVTTWRLALYEECVSVGCPAYHPSCLYTCSVVVLVILLNAV